PRKFSRPNSARDGNRRPPGGTEKKVYIFCTAAQGEVGGPFHRDGMVCRNLPEPCRTRDTWRARVAPGPLEVRRLMSLLSFVAAWVRRAPQGPRGRRTAAGLLAKFLRRRFRPRVEELESREVPNASRVFDAMGNPTILVVNGAHQLIEYDA